MQFIWTHVFPFINSFRPAWFHNAPFFFLIRHFSAPGPSWTSISAVESSGTACAMCKCYLVKYVWHMLDAVLFHTIQKYVHCAMYRYTFSLRRDQNIGAVDVSIWNLPKLKLISDRGSQFYTSLKKWSYLPSELGLAKLSITCAPCYFLRGTFITENN